MAGQATVTIEGRQWAVSLAITPYEFAQGLGGIPGMPPQTGMLFDLGYPDGITPVLAVPERPVPDGTRAG